MQIVLEEGSIQHWFEKKSQSGLNKVKKTNFVACGTCIRQFALQYKLQLCPSTNQWPDARNQRSAPKPYQFLSTNRFLSNFLVSEKWKQLVRTPTTKQVNVLYVQWLWLLTGNKTNLDFLLSSKLRGKKIKKRETEQSVHRHTQNLYFWTFKSVVFDFSKSVRFVLVNLSLFTWLSVALISWFHYSPHGIFCRFNVKETRLVPIHSVQSDLWADPFSIQSILLQVGYVPTAGRAKMWGERATFPFSTEHSRTR